MDLRRSARLTLGAALLFTGVGHLTFLRRPRSGRVAAGFFTAVFPGNLSQWWHRRNAFGLDTDGKRFARLFLQPVLVYWALKSTEGR